MQDISSGASYVQNLELVRAESGKQSALRSMCDGDPAVRHVWDLLQTPQTVHTLARQLDDDVSDIKASLTKLMREELIQISPDS